MDYFTAPNYALMMLRNCYIETNYLNKARASLIDKNTTKKRKLKFNLSTASIYFLSYLFLGLH